MHVSRAWRSAVIRQSSRPPTRFAAPFGTEPARARLVSWSELSPLLDPSMTAESDAKTFAFCL
jgi:hypothetical protein